MKLEGRVVFEEFDCEALNGNPLGDPHRRSIPIYLPPGYDRSGRRYSVIYWLHGWGGARLRETNYNPWIPSLPELIDRVIREGAPPAMLVMADVFTTYGHSQCVNSSATGRYEDAVKELVSYVDAHYRTMPAREHRGLDGKSSGGYGALVLAMRNPQLFGAVASHSGDMYFEACYKVDFWRAVDTIRKYGGLHGYLKAWREAPKKTDELVKPMVTVVCMAMAYSPNPERPHGFDLPFDPETGEIDEAVWARWLEWDPVFMAERYAAAGISTTCTTARASSVAGWSAWASATSTRSSTTTNGRELPVRGVAAPPMHRAPGVTERARPSGRSCTPG